MALQLFSEGETVNPIAMLMLGVLILIILYAYIGNFLQHKHFHFIHETGVGIIIGFVFGFLLKIVVGNDKQYQFNEQIFFFGLLPPMIFAGGYNLKKSNFINNFLYISLYGVLGTIVTFGIVLGLTLAINNKSTLSLSEAFSLSLIVQYSATICATDSVAALTMIKSDKYPKLFSIIFGEGMVNDAVAIILFRVVGPIFDVHPDTEQQNIVLTLLSILGSFCLNVVASLVIGVLCAMACSLVFKLSRFLALNSIAEVSVMYMFGILSYVIAELVHMSGVITVLVCGVALAHLNFYNLSITGQISTGVAFQTISFIAQALVFIYLGFSSITHIINHSQNINLNFVGLELAICAFARFATIFGLSYFVKIFKKKWKVSFYQLLIVSTAGVIRGSVAFALILTITVPSTNVQEYEHLKIIQSSVMLMVFVTTIILGAWMPFIIKQCLKRDTTQLPEGLLSETKSTQGKSQKQKKKKQMKGFKKFDEQYLKPFFIFDYTSRRQQIKQYKKLLKLNSPQYKGGQFTGMLVASARQTITSQPHVSLLTDQVNQTHSVQTEQVEDIKQVDDQ